MCYIELMLTLNRAPDKGGGGIEDKSKIFFLISPLNICCDPSLELSQ